MSDLDNLNFDQLVPGKSKYLAKEDVDASGFILTIRLFKRETIESDGEKEEKIVVYFEEDVKPMILNKTNAALLAAATGCKTVGEAKGKQVIVYNDPAISFQGKIVGGLRIKSYATAAPRQAPQRPAAAAAAHAAAPARSGIVREDSPPPDDDIPF